jgi:hypothetical protein
MQRPRQAHFKAALEGSFQKKTTAGLTLSKGVLT